MLREFRIAVSVRWERFHQIVFKRCAVCGGRIVKEPDGLRHIYHDPDCLIALNFKRAGEIMSEDPSLSAEEVWEHLAAERQQDDLYSGHA